MLSALNFTSFFLPPLYKNAQEELVYVSGGGVRRGILHVDRSSCNLGSGS